MKRYLSLFLTLTLAFFSFPLPSQAEGFNAGLIISDQELLKVNSMTVFNIQQFLDVHRGVLKTYFVADIDGQTKSAAEIIYNAAFNNQINPQYLLVLLQKEQGLITDTNPKLTQLQWATGYAVCDTCDVNHPSVKKYKGFAKQVNSAAAQTKYYLDNPDEFYFKAGVSYNIDGITVEIINSATAALYNYTPHINGNRIFWKLWNSWFRTTTYLDGSLLQAFGEPGVWLIKDGIRHAFTTKSALTSRYPLQQILHVDKTMIENYPIGQPISYAEYSLLRLPSGKIYLLANDELRWIIDEETFRLLGYFPDEIENVTEDDIAYFSDGSPITPQSLEPLGSLLQDPQSYGIYFVKDGIKYPLIAPELLSLNFPDLRSRKATAEELERYEKGDPVLLRDGLLVKTTDDPTVYVTADGQISPIDSEHTFITLGYQWDQIEVIGGPLRDLHTIGETITVAQRLSDEEAEQLVNEL